MGYPRKKNKAFKYPWNFHALKFHSPMFPDGTPYEVSIFNESSFQCQYRNTSCSSLFFCLVLWEQFPCFSRQISWMPLCNEFFSVLIFDLYYFSLLYKDNFAHWFSWRIWWFLFKVINGHDYTYWTCGWIFALTTTVVEVVVIAVLATFFPLV